MYSYSYIIINNNDIDNDYVVHIGMSYKQRGYSDKSQKHDWTRHDASTNRSHYYGDIPFEHFILKSKLVYPKDYRVFYNDNTRALIAKIFHRDLVLYNYKFGDP